MITAIHPVYLPSVQNRFQATLFSDKSIVAVVTAENVYDLTQEIKKRRSPPYRIGGLSRMN